MTEWVAVGIVLVGVVAGVYFGWRRWRSRSGRSIGEIRRRLRARENRRCASIARRTEGWPRLGLPTTSPSGMPVPPVSNRARAATITNVGPAERKAPAGASCTTPPAESTVSAHRPSAAPAGSEYSSQTMEVARIIRPPLAPLSQWPAVTVRYLYSQEGVQCREQRLFR